MDKVLADAGSGSGGVASGSVATRVGTTKLSKLEVAAVKSGLNSVEPAAVSSSTKSGKAATSKSGIATTRTDEEITLVFDRKKSVLHRLYNRARRNNPGIKGKIIFKLTIAPSGDVTKLTIVSSALNDKDLEAKLMRRIKQFKFGAKDVKPMTVTYPIEFLPA
jgi:TonB family protein